MKHLITAVDDHSVAGRLKISAGSYLCAIDGQEVLDVIDYELFVARERFSMDVETPGGGLRRVKVRKGEYEPMGLSFETGLMSPMRSCKNHCIFCFIDQMPKGGRSSLHVKDDDWRMSFIMGNYVTLTNLDERELDRIIRRRVSPLYVSLHASDPEVRRFLMKNPSAGNIVDQLKRLAEAELTFHLQIVLCPGINDGNVLRRSIADMLALYPYAQSLAIVPVGLTRYREGLYPMRVFTKEEANTVIDEIEALQQQIWKKHCTRFVFLADEWYTMTGRTLPPYEDYEDFAQIENGVGLLRLFEGEMLDALEGRPPLTEPKRFLMAGGVSAEPFFRESYQKLFPYGVTIETHAIQNHYFGESVTVGGLVTGGDLIEQIKGADFGRALLIPRAMLKADEEVFLDGVTREEAEAALNTRIIPVTSGEDLVEIVFSE